MSRKPILSVFVLVLAAGVPQARAQFAVIDIAAVTQLVTQVQTLEQELATARDHLAQARAEYDSITGGRGMELLLSGTVRNYLPPDWQQLSSAMQSAGGTFSALSAEVQTAIHQNALLTPAQMGALSASERAQLSAERQSVALLQALSHAALANTSGRFASLQQLINAIPAAGDQKAVLDLQARIAAEQGMLQNEQSKLGVLYQSVQAERWASEQRAWELAIAGRGQFESRFRPVP